MTDSVIHEPRRFLCNADGPMNFVGGCAVFAVYNLPHSHEPFVQAKWGILEDGPGLCGKLASIVARAALPAVVLLQERDILGAATRAFNAVRPAPCYDVFAAI